MAFDEDLANRIRESLADRDGVTEKAMFGGLAFLVGGKMAVAAASAGQLMVRIDPADGDELVATDGVERMVMREREMDGWLLVAPEVLRSDSDLAAWVERGVAFAATV